MISFLFTLNTFEIKSVPTLWFGFKINHENCNPDVNYYHFSGLSQVVLHPEIPATSLPVLSAEFIPPPPKIYYFLFIIKSIQSFLFSVYFKIYA